jgi:uncharacterized membrane protein YfcA
MFYFVLGFAQVALISFQSRNYAQGRYTASFITSLLIACVWWFMVHSISTSAADWGDGVGYVLGNALGGVFGIWLHQKLSSRKKDE